MTLTAPAGPASTTFLYWDVDGVSLGNYLVNPITVTMNAAHAATAHYYVPGVGGEWAPASAVQLLILCIGLVSTMAVAASLVGVRRIRKRQD